MPINFIEDIKSITDLKLHTTSVLDQVKRTKRPVVLTVNGKAQAVLVDAEEYDKMSASLQVLKLLIPAEQDVREGRYEEAGQFFKEFKRDKKI